MSKEYVNMNVDIRKGGRKAVKMSIDDFKKETEYAYKKYLLEQGEDLTFRSSRYTIGNFVYSICYGSKKNEKSDVAKYIYDDVWNGKYKFDSENVDNVGDVKMSKKGFPYIEVRAGGDWECPVCFFVYFDGSKFRGYVPLKGNAINRDAKQAFQGDNDPDGGEMKFLYKELGKDTKLNGGNVDYNIDACTEDFLSRVEVKGVYKKKNYDKFFAEFDEKLKEAKKTKEENEKEKERMLELNENQLRKILKESVKRVINESFGHYKSKRLANIISRHGMARYGNMSSHYMLTQLRDDNIEGVSKNEIEDRNRHSYPLADGKYLVYNCNDNQVAREYCGIWCGNFAGKVADTIRPNNEFARARDFNNISDNLYSREQFKHTTSRGDDARDLRNNPYFRRDKDKEYNKDSGWNRKEADRVMNNLRSGKDRNGRNNRIIRENEYKNQFNKIISAINVEGKKRGWSKERITNKIQDTLARLQAQSDINRSEGEKRMKERGRNFVSDKITDPLANTDFSNLWDIDMNNIG